MLQKTREVFEESHLTWNDHPEPAELAALEDIQRAGWFDEEEPVVVSLSDLVEAVSSVSDSEEEVLATVSFRACSFWLWWSLPLAGYLARGAL